MLDQAEARADWVSQAYFADQHGIGSQSMLWQYKNGRRALNLDAVIGFAAGLGVPVADISPTLAQRLAAARPTHDTTPVLAPDEQKLLDLYRLMDEDRRRETLGFAAYARTISHPAPVEIEAESHRKKAIARRGK